MVALVGLIAIRLEREALGRTEATERRSSELASRRRNVLAACHAPGVHGLVFATTSTVWDAWRLHTHVRGERHTYICGRGSGTAAVTSAIDRQAAHACHGHRWLLKFQVRVGRWMSKCRRITVKMVPYNAQSAPFLMYMR